MTINPVKILGNWDEGYVLDKHMIRSSFLGEDVYGNPKYDNIRSELGELIYQIKYQHKYDNIDKVIDLIKPFIDSWKVLDDIDIILPVPASKYRERQPVNEIAFEISKYLKVHYVDDVLSKESSEQAKDMNYGEKQGIKIIAKKKAKKKHKLLLIDDLYQTGATLNECVKILREDSLLEKIYVLVMTKTKD